MSYSHGSITIFVPAAVAPEAIGDKPAMVAFDAQNKAVLVKKLIASTSGGFADRALASLLASVPAESLRDFIDVAENDSWRFTYHHGVQLRQIGEDLHRLLDWVAVHPLETRDLVEFPDQSFKYTEAQMRDAISSDLVCQSPWDDPRVKDGHYGDSPWYLFTYWRSLREIYDEAVRERAAIIRYMYVA